MIRNSKLQFVVVIFCGFLAGMVSPAFSQSTQEIEKHLNDEKRELNKLRDKIARNNKELSTKGKEESNILKTLEILGDRSRLKERELKIYHWNMEMNKNKLARIEKNIQTVESQLEKQKRIVRERLRMIYKEGDMFMVKVLFSADNYSDLLQRLKYMEMIMSYDSRNFKDYALRLEKLNRDKIKLEEGRKSLLGLEESALIKVKELNREKKTKSRFLKKIMGQQVYLVQTRKELMKASEALNDLISKLEEKRILGQKIGLDDVKGRLDWPVPGKILNRFGKKRDRKLGAYIVNNGVSLKASKGTPVKSVFHGKVLYTGFLEGYGNLIIVGHGNNYHSLYGHLDKIKVAKGDTVKEGQIVGKSGESGSLEGETLYFELRHQGKPIEPMKWFRVARK